MLIYCTTPYLHVRRFEVHLEAGQREDVLRPLLSAAVSSALALLEMNGGTVLIGCYDYTQYVL